MEKVAVTKPSAGTRPSLPGLTGLRGVGAVWVLLFHAQFCFVHPVPVLRAGYLGVDLFFVLSGFVLSYAHPGLQWSFSRHRAFLLARFARIFPMHWAALLLIVVVVAVLPEIRSASPHIFRLRDLVLTATLGSGLITSR